MGLHRVGFKPSRLDSSGTSGHHIAMQIPTVPPPQSEEELLKRCQALAGLSLQQLAEQFDLEVPQNLKRHKGWVGQLIELALGADAQSLAEPDFRAIGVELKTLPVDLQGKPRESTYVCTVPLEEGIESSWKNSWICRKLARVLWLPVEADPTLPLPSRRIGSAMLWSPGEEEEAQLQQDWEELTEMICMGELEQITARMGTVLQIRPKAANSRVRCRSIGAGGEAILTNPRGYYLRPGFTHQLLQRYYYHTK